MRANKPLALTLGEPAGIGPDIALAAWARRKELALPPFYLAGDRRFLDGRANRLGLQVPTASVAPARGDRCVRKRPAGRRYRRCRNRRARQARRARAPQPPSPRSATRSTTCARAAPAPSSPIRSPRACSIGPASSIPATPNILAELAANGAQRRAAAGDDAVVAYARRHPGDDPCGAARGHRAADDARHRRDLHDRRRRAASAASASPIRGFAVSGLNPHAGEDGIARHARTSRSSRLRLRT